MRENFVEKLGLTVKPAKSQIYTFDATKTESVGFVTLDLDFTHFQLKNQKVYAFRELSCNLILSGSIFEKLEILRNPYHIEINLNGFHFPCGQNSKQLIRAHSDFEISANSFKVIEFDKHVPIGTDYFSDPVFRHPDLRLEPVLARDKILLAFSNFRPYDVIIRKGTPLAELTPSININNLQVIENSEQEEKRLRDHNDFRMKKFGPHRKPVSVKFGNMISESVKTEISKIINNHKMAFSSAPNDIGLVKNYRYKIDLKNTAKRWYQAPRRIGENVRPKLQEIFKKELEAGLISEGSSVYNTPLVLVRKASGEIRVCLDLRLCNKNIEVEKFPLPDLYLSLIHI